MSGLREGSMIARLHQALGATVAVPLLVVAMSACGPSDDQDVSGAEAGVGEATPVTSPTSTADNTSSERPSEPAEPLTHEAALDGGLAGQMAIHCVYHFDAQERAQQELFSPTGWSTPVADIYLNADAVYWEIPQEDGRTSHVLGVDDTTYAWKTPGDAKGALGDNATDQDSADTQAVLKAHTRDCAAYTGPLSIFEPDPSITYTSFPGS